jgi:hypothetical protein
VTLPALDQSAGRNGVRPQAHVAVQAEANVEYAMSAATAAERWVRADGVFSRSPWCLGTICRTQPVRLARPPPTTPERVLACRARC